VVGFPDEWIQHVGANLTTAYPRAMGARFRYHERVQPQPSFATIVDRILAGDPEFHAHEVGAMNRIVTLEGEYGAWVRIDGRRDGAHAVHFIGAVFMDEFATVLDCIAVISSQFAAVEALSIELLRSEALQMRQRPRRFFYVPPAGWQSIPSGLTASWYPLDFPANQSTIVVAPAMVIDIEPAKALEAALATTGAGLTVTTMASEELTSAAGITGVCVRVHGRREGKPQPIDRDLALFIVGGRAYRMRLETSNTPRLLELREVFLAVVTSFRPLPLADEAQLGRAFADRSVLFDHWAS
jgi:hypothetical protein